MSRLPIAASLVAALLAVAAPGRAADKVDFEKQIWPIFQKSCVECHGAKKQKAKLRLDSPQAILEGAGRPGHKDKVIVPGKPQVSLVWELITLPADDDDIMPPADAGKPLTKQQTDLIKLWIEQNAPFGDWKGVVDGPEKAPDLVTTLEAPKADPAALKKLQDLGALAMPIAANSNLITVDFRAVADQIGDSHLDLLAPLAQQVTWLNLAKTKISDAGLAKLKNLKNLNRLHLEQTAVGDAGVAHLSGADNLEYLNLYGTKVSDAGLKNLQGLKNLKKVFVWQTQVTQAGAESLRKAKDGLYVNRGWEGPPVELPKAKDEGPSISQIMKEGHKGDGSLLKKVLDQKANDAEKKKLLGFYEVLAKAKCPKGDAKSWKDKTGALLAAMQKVAKNDSKGLEELKAASNCKACHSKHK